MTTMYRRQIPSEGSRIRWAVTSLCAAFLIFYLATVHAQHIPTPDSNMTLGVLNAQATELLGAHIPALHAGMGMDGMDCPFPSLLTPRAESMPDVVSALFWWLPPLAIARVVPRMALAAAPVPRPTGPSRQALLQRFLL